MMNNSFDVENGCVVQERESLLKLLTNWYFMNPASTAYIVCVEYIIHVASIKPCHGITAATTTINAYRMFVKTFSNAGSIL